MNNPFFFVTIYGNDSINIFKSAKKLGYKSEYAKYVPFVGVDKSEIPKDCTVIPYGSINFLKNIQSHNMENVIHFCNWKNFECTDYMPFFSEYSIHKEYGYLTIGELLDKKNFIYDNFSLDSHVFFRPNSGDKIFNGELVAYENFKKFISIGVDYVENIDRRTLLMFSKPSIINREWRFVVSNKMVITGSLYKERENNSLNVVMREEKSKELIDWVQSITLNSPYEPEKIYCFDVAEVDDGYRFMEINSINSSGLYCCDVDVVVEELAKFAQ